MTDNVFVAVWDDLGLEAVFDLTEYYNQNNLLTVIAGEKGSRNPLTFWKLRARYNSQRNYEIHAFGVEDGITVEDVVKHIDQLATRV